MGYAAKRRSPGLLTGTSLVGAIHPIFACVRQCMDLKASKKKRILQTSWWPMVCVNHGWVIGPVRRNRRLSFFKKKKNKLPHTSATYGKRSYTAVRLFILATASLQEGGSFDLGSKASKSVEEFDSRKGTRDSDNHESKGQRLL